MGKRNQELNFEPSISAPGMWRFPTNPDLCCIYRVPNILRQVNPKAYTPQLLIIGPLHHSLKAQALKRLEDIDNTKFMGYLSMEQHKKIYLPAFAQRFVVENFIGAEDIIARFRYEIKEEEESIRASYSESTTWINSEDFVEMILLDSVFILEFILRRWENSGNTEKTGDILIDEPCLINTIDRDFILLENQLPFFVLQKLFDPFITVNYVNLTFRKIIIIYFGLKDKMNENSKFRHFTDLLRCVRVDLLNLEQGEVSGLEKYDTIKNMYNAEKLNSVGIKFKVIEEELSLNVKFENGCLEVPRFMVYDSTEKKLRNIMALEQCHYPYKAYVCSFISFLDYLIDTDKDVDFLVEKGIIENWIGNYGSVADMVNKLSLGIVDSGSCYYDIAKNIETHYKSPLNRSRAVLKSVYFSNPWTGTATLAAIFLLILTLAQTITSIIQVL